MSFVAPDWKIESQYPDPDKVTDLGVWAWEFLRRNKDYQAAWDAYCARVSGIANRLPQLTPVLEWLTAGPNTQSPSDEFRGAWADLCKLLQNQIEFFQLTPAALSTETAIDEWRNRTNAGAYSVVPLDRYSGEAWELERIVNPAFTWSQASKTVNGVRFKNLAGGLEYVKNGTPSIDYQNCVTAVFDLRRPVNVLKAEFAALLRMRESLVKAGNIKAYTSRPDKSLSNFQHYLRVIDASDAGVSVADIASQLLPHQDAEGRNKTVQNWKKKGNKIRKEEFRTLPAYSAGIGKKK